MIWKCFRCNLTFNEKSVAKLHDDVNNHGTMEVIEK